MNDYIFISYAHKDMERVKPIIETMRKKGYRVWYDEGIDPGTEWADYIAKQLENCGYFIAFISEFYLQSSNCRDEIEYARDLNKKRFLIYLEDVELPGGMKMRLSRVQNIHHYTYDNETDFFNKLFAAEGLDLCKGDVLEQETEEGPTEAGEQYALGCKYDIGQGVERNDVLAVKWYRKAAEQGHTMSQFNMGCMYQLGRGVEQDYTQAAKWFKKAAGQGHAVAQFNLGVMYGKGQGVEQNDELSAEWHRRAAEQGDMDSQLQLGVKYNLGRGVPQDDIQSVYWFRRAAEQGQYVAQYNLGIMYELGRGVEQNYHLAMEWYQKSAEQGYEKARIALNELLGR